MDPKKPVLALLLALAPLATDAAPPPDLAARGLDAFLHVPSKAPPRATVPVQIEAVGFPTAVQARPLPGADVEAVWNAETLGPHVAVAPPAVRTTTDASGLAHLDVPMPDGDERDLELLVGLRSGVHARTRKVTVKRVRPNDVALYVPDRRVVPGSTMSAWILVTSASTGNPVARAPVTLSLSEGGVPGFLQTITTDASGMAMARVPIPPTQEPSWTWELRAQSLREGMDAGGTALTLTPREETPGKATLKAEWKEGSVLAGDAAHFAARVRDANDLPLASLPVRYWIGPKGTEPPADQDGWDKVATRAVTSATGEVSGESATPRTVVKTVGTTLRLVVRTQVEGRDLSAEATVEVGAPNASAELTPEEEAIVPGLEQRMLLRVLDDRARPVSGPFAVEGDGLRARVRTNDDGEAEITWRAPMDLGAAREIGPCAGGVAAAVTVRAEESIPRLTTHPDPFQVCVKVDRDAAAIVRADRPLARAGDKIRVRVDAARKPAAEWSVVASNDAGTQATSAWAPDPVKGVELTLPEGASGVWTLSAASPGRGAPGKVARGALLVAPRVLPKLGARVASGRAAPGGAVDVEATLTDEKGRGLPGTVSAVMIDRAGGGSLGGLAALDTRTKLCNLSGVDAERCDRFLEGDPALEPLRRTRFGRHGQALDPTSDPGGHFQEELRKAFRDVVHSLEGAVFESTRSADQLRDVRRRGPGGEWTFNPELLTLVTAAMEPPPEMPGGEPIALRDLVAIDPQVTFSNVARRVTRLKLFTVLAAVRRFKAERQIDPDEPALRDPNALLRRLVREGALAEPQLLDPWGGTIAFVASNRPPFPFLTVARGWELHAPGPDGKLGTGDDVRDPFERVLRSGSPYATAVDEDRIVDAKWEMEVAEPTVSAWQAMLEELTGSHLGRGEGIGLGGIGTIGHGEGGGGTGQGFGSGHGRISLGTPTGVAFWSAPMRTDANGRVTIHVPLGDVETTWRIALVGVPDGATPATTSVDVPSQLPISGRVELGNKWIEGDALDALVVVRNRTTNAARAKVTVSASGAAALEGPKERTVEVPASGQATARVRLKATRAGEAALEVVTRAPGVPDDVVRHTWRVGEAGEPVDLAHVEWIDGETDLSAHLDPTPYRALGPARVIIERGLDVALASALEALDPDRLRGPSEMADALEVGARVREWALRQKGRAGTREDALQLRAAQVQRRALGRLAAYVERDGSSAGGPQAHAAASLVPWTAWTRTLSFLPAERATALPKRPDCPEASAESELQAGVDGLDAEPPPLAGGVPACWDAFVSTVMDRVDRSEDAVSVARAVLALTDRPHRAARAANASQRLRHLVGLDKKGAVGDDYLAIALPPQVSVERAARATVYAGLLRAAATDRAHAREAPRLMAWIGVQRDLGGGYGSTAATRAVVRALLAASPPEAARAKLVAKVTIDGRARTLEVPPSGLAALLVPLGAKELVVDAQRAVARLERPGLRPWTRPPTDEVAADLHAEITWPDARAGRTGLVRIALRSDVAKGSLVDVRLPLPPGVSLADVVPGVRLVQGVLSVRHAVDPGPVSTDIEVPVRFGLAGQVTVPEAVVRYAEGAGPRAVVPARSLRIAPL